MKLKFNLKTTIVLMVFVLVSMPVFAQPGPGGGRRQMSEDDVKRRVEALADTLQLNDKQEKEILVAELKFYDKLQQERQNFDPETGDREAMREKMRGMRAEVDKTYEKVLTEEQYAKYTEIREARRSQMRQRRDGGQGSGEDRGRGRGRGQGGG